MLSKLQFSKIQTPENGQTSTQSQIQNIAVISAFKEYN